MRGKSIREQLAQWCIYYERDFSEGALEKCGKGMVYKEVAAVAELGEFGWGLRIPCLRMNHDEKRRRGEPLCRCPHLEWPSEEQLDADEEAYRDMFEKVVEAGPLIEQVKQDHEGENWEGEVDCPVCGGDLWLAHSASNGHVQASCGTAGCLSFME